MVSKFAWAVCISRCTKLAIAVFDIVFRGNTCPVRDIEHVAGPTIATFFLLTHVIGYKTAISMPKTLRGHANDQIMNEHFGLQNMADYGQGGRIVCTFSTLFATGPEPWIADRPWQLVKAGVIWILGFTAILLLQSADRYSRQSKYKCAMMEQCSQDGEFNNCPASLRTLCNDRTVTDRSCRLRILISSARRPQRLSGSATRERLLQRRSRFKRCFETKCSFVVTWKLCPRGTATLRTCDLERFPVYWLHMSRYLVFRS